MIHNLSDARPKRNFLEEMALDVLKGFSESPKNLPSKYFYDDRGSELFSQITGLEDYYPTRCEREVFEDNKSRISRLLPREPFNLIELGAGDGQKTRILLEQFLRDDHAFEYIPVDISAAAVGALSERFDEIFPGLKKTGLVGDYDSAVDWIARSRPGKNVVLFLGSNIGNFSQVQALTFLRVLWKSLNHGDYFLIGFDLKKDIAVLNRAYNDCEGITREFNLNMLRRLNRELGADFDLTKFMHYGFYNPFLGAMESCLVAKEGQVVHFKALAKSFDLAAFEPIHLEFSNKYLISDIEYFAAETGFKVVSHYFDEKKYFADSLWQVEKDIF